MISAGARRILAVPHWLAKERWGSMQIHQHILKCTVFLGFKTELGFQAFGTGFVLNYVEEDVAFSYIVSCRHLVQPTLSDGSKNPAEIWLRVNTKGGEPKLIKTISGDWSAHKDKVDACIIGYQSEWDADNNLDVAPLDPSMIMDPEKEDKVGLSLGDGVFIASLFIGRPGEKVNIPIVRIGNIAALPSEPIWPSSARHPAYLVETKSLGGTSGAPIFLNLHPSRKFGRWGVPHDPVKNTISLPYLLLGMMQGAHGGHYADEFVIEDGTPIIPTDSMFNAGISVGVPISQICEIFEYDALKSERRGVIDEKKKQTGYRPTSGGRAAKAGKPSSPTVADENPRHREDFTSLLSAAAKTKPQAD